MFVLAAAIGACLVLNALAVEWKSIELVKSGASQQAEADLWEGVNEANGVDHFRRIVENKVKKKKTGDIASQRMIVGSASLLGYHFVSSVWFAPNKFSNSHVRIK